MTAGFVMGVDFALSNTKTTLETVCDSCDNIISNQDAVFCENCFDEDDKLSSAIKEKELYTRYEDLALKQRNTLNPPSMSELNKLQNDSIEIIELCDSVDKITQYFGLKIDVNPLRQQNNALCSNIDKWKLLLKRDEKLDELIKSEDRFTKPFSLWSKNTDAPKIIEKL